MLELPIEIALESELRLGGPMGLGGLSRKIAPKPPL